MIRIEKVVHHYGIRPILRGLDLQVKPGELLVIMGPNGCGKTTLLGVMAGALCPIEGHVTINGVRRRSSEEGELEIRRRVYYLPAEPWLPETVTAREFIMAVGLLYDVPDLRLMDHTDRLLQLFDLADKGDTPISFLSTGQRKKVALCSALVTEVPILLMDEPFSGGLDPGGIMALKQVLIRLAKREDVTVVITSPVPELVEEVAERVAILHNGKVLACDTVNGLRNLAQCEGPLAEVLERLIHPATPENITAYFKDRPE